jgi:hypothetical protein
VSTSTNAGRSANVSALAIVLGGSGVLLIVFAIQWFWVLSKNGTAQILVNQPILFHTAWMPTGALFFALWCFTCSYYCWTNRALALPIFVALWIAFAACMLLVSLVQGTKPLWFVGLSAALFGWLGIKLANLLRIGFQSNALTNGSGV